MFAREMVRLQERSRTSHRNLALSFSTGSRSMDAGQIKRIQRQGTRAGFQTYLEVLVRRAARAKDIGPAVDGELGILERQTRDTHILMDHELLRGLTDIFDKSSTARNLKIIGTCSPPTVKLAPIRQGNQ